MSVSIQELDNIVRAFYEGQGDIVSVLPRQFMLSFDKDVR